MKKLFFALMVTITGLVEAQTLIQDSLMRKGVVTPAAFPGDFKEYIKSNLI